MLSIGFVGSQYIANGTPFRNVVITVPNMVDICPAELSTWKESDYELSWTDGLQSIVSGARDRAALVVSMPTIRQSSFLHWWPIYRDQGVVVIREQLLMLADLQGVMTEKNYFDFVPERHRTQASATGREMISEWTVLLADLCRYSAARALAMTDIVSDVIDE